MADTLRAVKNGSTDWKVKVRIIREWRGVTKTGEVFKGFNVLLLDSKNTRIQAFAPAAVAEKIGRMIQLGKLYTFSNFEVKNYTENDKFRAVQSDRQINFTAKTKVTDIDESQIFIPKNMFDFFQFEDLKKIAGQQLHLADVVGIIPRKEKLNQFQNKHGKHQTNIKFKLSDGNTKINVTFWDSFAEQFEKEMSADLEEPIILIIASGRVTSWNEQIDICNYSPTKFYLNYDHHSVHQLRKMLKGPNFSKHNFCTKTKSFKICTVEEISILGEDYIQDEVICKATFKSVGENQDWIFWVCTSCYEKVQMQGNEYFCQTCKREVALPITRFKIVLVASDATGDIKISLQDRAVRTLLEDTKCDIQDPEKHVPNHIKKVIGKGYTIKLLITKDNVNKTDNVYFGIDLFLGFNYDNKNSEAIQTSEISEGFTAQPSASTYHLDDISQLNYQEV